VLKIVLATHNPHKVEEMQALFAGVCEFVPLPKGAVAPEENGGTFVANARIKALAAAQSTGLWALADDSGICIDALDGDPGVDSAYWAGPNSTAPEWIEKTLRLLKDVPDAERTARYVCILSLMTPSGDILAETEGALEGRIAHAPQGNSGFGYDPIFLVSPDFTQTAAQIAPEEKNARSHRAIAAQKLRVIMESQSESPDDHPLSLR
jgi:XTP/dITP diphosphohydrolase